MAHLERPLRNQCTTTYRPKLQITSIKAESKRFFLHEKKRDREGEGIDQNLFVCTLYVLGYGVSIRNKFGRANLERQKLEAD